MPASDASSFLPKAETSRAKGLPACEMVLDIIGDLFTHGRQLKHLVFDGRIVSDAKDFSAKSSHRWRCSSIRPAHLRCVRATITLSTATDPNAKPQSGISFLLIDIKLPGVTVR
jgi:hypothetical protein